MRHSRSRRVTLQYSTSMLKVVSEHIFLFLPLCAYIFFMLYGSAYYFSRKKSIWFSFWWSQMAVYWTFHAMCRHHGISVTFVEYLHAALPRCAHRGTFARFVELLHASWYFCMLCGTLAPLMKVLLYFMIRLHGSQLTNYILSTTTHWFLTTFLVSTVQKSKMLWNAVLHHKKQLKRRKVGNM